MAEYHREKLTNTSDLLKDPSCAKSEYGSVGSSDICIMVAGKPGNGKSTALNNIFGLNQETEISCHSVTKKIHVQKVKKNGVNLTILDTPGLGALDINQKLIILAMSEALKKMDYTLLYCLSVGPSNRLTEVDKAIIQNLQSTLGPQVWDKCVVLFTFSDMTRRESFNTSSQDSNYKIYLKNVAEEFSKIIKCGSSEGPTVKSVLEFSSTDDIHSRVDTHNDIIAIPVGKIVPSNNNLSEMSSERAHLPDILPGILKPTDDWTDLVFIELMRKTKNSQRKPFVVLKYGAAIAASISSFVAAGAAIGGAAGTATGAVLSPIGSLAAGSIGAAAGAGVGGVIGMAITAIVTVLKLRREKTLGYTSTIAQ